MSEERRAQNVQMAEDISAMKTLLEVHLTGENGLTGRVKKLEKSQERQWWATYVATPVIIAVGHVARAFGAKI